MTRLFDYGPKIQTEATTDAKGNSVASYVFPAEMKLAPSAVTLVVHWIWDDLRHHDAIA